MGRTPESAQRRRRCGHDIRPRGHRVRHACVGVVDSIDTQSAAWPQRAHGLATPAAHACGAYRPSSAAWPPRACCVRAACAPCPPGGQRACARGEPRNAHATADRQPRHERRGRRGRGSRAAGTVGGRGRGRRGHHHDRPRPGRVGPGRVHRSPRRRIGVSRDGGLAGARRARRLPDLHPAASPPGVGGQHRRHRRAEPPERGADAAAGAPHRRRGRAALRAPLAGPGHPAAGRHRSAGPPGDRATAAVAPLRHRRARPRPQPRPPHRRHLAARARPLPADPFHARLTPPHRGASSDLPPSTRTLVRPRPGHHATCPATGPTTRATAGTDSRSRTCCCRG